MQKDDKKLSDLEVFKNRKNFNELVTDLAIKFNQRRAGNDTENNEENRS
jgi:CRISPR-associated protein Cmr2